MNFFKHLIIGTILFSFCHCSDSGNESKDFNEGMFKIESSMDISDTNTEFKFRVSFQDPTISSQSVINSIKWDFDSDGIYDTDWIYSDSLEHVFSNTGTYNISARVLFDENEESDCYARAFVQPTVNLMGIDTSAYVSEICYGFDESEAYFVTGHVPHDIYKMSLNDGIVTGVTTNLVSSSCRHIPITSPDGNYIAYWHQRGLYLFDLNTNEEKEISADYVLGSNSFTNNSKYVLVNNAVGDEIHFIDIISGSDSLLITNAHEFAVVPNSSEIAYFKAYPDSVNQLIFYDLVSNEVRRIFDDLPYSDPFQVLENPGVIYYTNLKIIYILASGNEYKIYTDGFSDWDNSAISKDGTNALYSYQKSILKMTLPTNLE